MANMSSTNPPAMSTLPPVVAEAAPPAPRPAAIRVPSSVSTGSRQEIIGFILKTDRMDPLKNFLYLVYSQTRPRYHDEFYRKCKQVILMEIDAAQFFEFVRRACTFSSVSEHLAARLSAWMADINRTADRIQAAARGRPARRIAAD